MRAQILPMRARKDQSCLLRSACYRHCLSAKCWSQCVCVALCVLRYKGSDSALLAHGRAQTLCVPEYCVGSPQNSSLLEIARNLFLFIGGPIDRKRHRRVEHSQFASNPSFGISDTVFNLLGVQ